jgi:alpha/beta superfamily hydrolase
VVITTRLAGDHAMTATATFSAAHATITTVMGFGFGGVVGAVLLCAADWTFAAEPLVTALALN